MATPVGAAPAARIKELRVRATPETDLVPSNLLFVNEREFDRFPVYLAINGIVLTANPHPSIAEGTIAFNSVHREECRVSVHEMVTVQVVDPPRPTDYLSKVAFEMDLVVRNRTVSEPVQAEKLAERIKRVYSRQVFTVGQKLVVDFNGVNLLAVCTSVETVGQLDPSKMAATSLVSLIGATSGMLTSDTVVDLAKRHGSSLPFVAEKTTTRKIFQADFSFEKLGIGGLDSEMSNIFRRAFASRVYSSSTIKKLGIKHVKGILLYGPPGTGKTLIARQIGKMLNCKEPKLVNGPEILDKYVGGSQEKIRALFVDAEEDYRANGDDAELHLIIFDELDAICRKRGSTNDNTGVNDSIVNQLLAKMDGVEEVNNVLVIGMTNRKDMIDDALLRPGRFEVHMEIGLPDEAGRLQILRIHTKQMREQSCLAPDIDFPSIAERTKNFSGAELGGLVRSATSFALNRNVDVNDPSKPINDEVVLTSDDFEHALDEVRPAFGVSSEEVAQFVGQGLIDYGPTFSHLLMTCRALVHQVAKSGRTQMLSALLEGPLGSGKTALAAHLALEAEFPFLKFISPESMVGTSESYKCSTIAKVFDDSYKSPLSVIVLDNIERLVEYVHIGPRFSNNILQTLLVLIKKLPPKGRKLLIIGTTSSRDVLEPMELVDAFNIVLNVPALNDKDDIRRVLNTIGAVHPNDLEDVVAVTPLGIGIKKLLVVVEMALAEHLVEIDESGGAASSSTGGDSSQPAYISVDRYVDCLRDSGFMPDRPRTAGRSSSLL